jgi:hypothetical protein
MGVIDIYDLRNARYHNFIQYLFNMAGMPLLTNPLMLTRKILNS